MRTPLVDSNLNPIYSIYCGCPDCGTLVTMQTSVSIGLLCMNEVTQEFWDLNYKNALELWKEKYGKKEESITTLVFFVQGTLEDCNSVFEGFDERGIKYEMVPTATTPLTGGSIITFKCDVPDNVFDWALDRVRRHPKVSGICTPDGVYGKLEESE